MQLAAVCGREIGGHTAELGTSGYTLNNVFVLYDRRTGSVWYPLSDEAFDAVAGPARGERLEFVAKPDRVPLRDWVHEHPDTLVLLPQ